MNYNELFIYYRAIIVSILASVSDISVMFTLDRTKLNESIILILSSFTGLLIQFFGQKYWTFKSVTKSSQKLMYQVAQFFTLEISLILFIVFMYGYVYEYVTKVISKYNKNYANGVFTKYIFKLDKNNNIILTNIGKILLKSVMVFILFNAISYPIWRYVIFVEKK
jgi:putative flippase GtrA